MDLDCLITAAHGFTASCSGHRDLRAVGTAWTPLFKAQRYAPGDTGLRWLYWPTSENLAPFSSGAPAPLICWPSQAAVHTTQPLTYVHLVTDAMPLAEDVENELEALLYTYASDQVSFTRSNDGACSVSLALVPRQEQQFVTATLNLAIKPGYPVASPDVDVRDAKGLDDAHLQQLLHLLQAEDAQLSGELRLGHLCEVAISYMDDNNRPEGAWCVVRGALQHLIV